MLADNAACYGKHSFLRWRHQADTSWLQQPQENVNLQVFQNSNNYFFFIKLKSNICCYDDIIFNVLVSIK